MTGMTSLATVATLLLPPLTPAERQLILRRLKRGPVLSRQALAEYANRLRREVVAERVGVCGNGTEEDRKT